jgi:hypothetical protein
MESEISGLPDLHAFIRFKQHLRIKSFFGTSTNAVKTQIWIAVSIYLLVVASRQCGSRSRTMRTWKESVLHESNPQDH